jgi:hypothetical protein
MMTSNFDRNAARTSIQSRTAPVNSRERNDASTGVAVKIRKPSRRQQGKKPRAKQHGPGRRERMLAAQLRNQLMNQPYTQPTLQPDIQPAYQSNMQPAYQFNMQPAYQSNMQPIHSRRAPSEAPTWITVVR